MNFCAQCAGTVSFRSIEGDHLPRYVCNSCATVHYQNPRVIVGCLCIWEDKVLLCRRNIEPRLGYWNVPGGFMENGETVEEGGVREAIEEAAVKITPIGIHSVFSVPKVNQVHIHLLANMTEPTWQLTPESSEIRLFSRAEIPWDELAFESSKFILRQYFQDIDNQTRTIHVGEYLKLTY